MSVPTLQPVIRRHVGALPVLRFHDVRQLVHAVAHDDVRQELADEENAREERRARREHTTPTLGRRAHCGGCQWILRDPSQPCPRCGFTNGYGYPR